MLHLIVSTTPGHARCTTARRRSRIGRAKGADFAMYASTSGERACGADELLRAAPAALDARARVAVDREDFEVDERDVRDEPERAAVVGMGNPP